jgi:hypothetical protein
MQEAVLLQNFSVCSNEGEFVIHLFLFLLQRIRIEEARNVLPQFKHCPNEGEEAV